MTVRLFDVSVLGRVLGTAERVSVEGSVFTYYGFVVNPRTVYAISSGDLQVDYGRGTMKLLPSTVLSSDLPTDIYTFEHP